MDQSLRASYFSQITDDKLAADLSILPPYEPKGGLAQWVRGSIKLKEGPYVYQDQRDLVVTGPRMRVCYSGCKWNRICTEMRGLPGTPAYDFQQWLYKVASVVRDTIWQAPERYKPGAKTNTRFLFDNDIIHPSSDPSRFPDELRCRLSTTRRLIAEPTDDAAYEDVVDADLFQVSDQGVEIPVDPALIQAGWTIIPVIKFSYYRNVERFGLSMTIVKAIVEPKEQGPRGPSNSDWVIDYPPAMDMSEN